MPTPIFTYLGDGSGSSLSVVGDGGNESTVAYPPPQHDPSNGDRSLALKKEKKKRCNQMLIL